MASTRFLKLEIMVDSFGSQADKRPRTRILLVDDDAKVRPLLSSMLQLSGYEVVEASNGADGLQRFRELSAEIVLCDLAMPVTDGLEMIREFGRDFPGIPVIAMSGSGEHGGIDLLEMASDLGAVSILQKPFSLAVLLAAIDRALDRRRRQGDAHFV